MGDGVSQLETNSVICFTLISNLRRKEIFLGMSYVVCQIACADDLLRSCCKHVVVHEAR